MFPRNNLCNVEKSIFNPNITLQINQCIVISFRGPVKFSNCNRNRTGRCEIICKRSKMLAKVAIHDFSTLIHVSNISQGWTILKKLRFAMAKFSKCICDWKTNIEIRWAACWDQRRIRSFPYWFPAETFFERQAGNDFSAIKITCPHSFLCLCPYVGGKGNRWSSSPLPSSLQAFDRIVASESTIIIARSITCTFVDFSTALSAV